ncbi:hypothetical protein GQR58_019216 [Nymphon striatum]|nr:hypothetical protein GQR58_019216 [Nymphon striatum]
MMALFEANPQAFDGSNVNNLKAGALMRRPTIQQAKGITNRTARRQLASHTKAWKQRTQVAGNAASTKRVAKNTQANGANTQAHMVVSGSDGAKVNGSGAAGSAAVSDLKQKLVLASESLTSKTNENSELKSSKESFDYPSRVSNSPKLQASVGGGEVSPTAEPETAIVQTEVEEPISTEVGGGEGEDIQAQVANQNANANGEIIRTGEPEVEVEAEPEVAVVPPKPKPIISTRRCRYPRLTR